MVMKNSDHTAPKLPPLRQPVLLSPEAITDTGYEYVSGSHNQSTVIDCSKSLDSELLYKTSKASCYESLSFSESQIISIDYSKNVIRLQKKHHKKDEHSSHCNPYEEAVANGEPIYEDPGTSKEKIYAYFERRKFLKIPPKDLR